MGNAAAAKQIALLQKARHKMARSVHALESDYASISYKHAFLTIVCDGLGCLRQYHGQQQGGSRLSDGEVLLLQQLSQLTYCGCSTTGSRSCTFCQTSLAAISGQQQQQQPQLQSLAPASDPLRLFYDIGLLPPFPGADSMTLTQLQDDYQLTIRDLAVALQHHEAGIGTGAQHSSTGATTSPVQQIEALVRRHLHITSSMLNLQRHELVAAFSVQHKGAEVQTEPDLDTYRRVVAAVGIQGWQQQHIAANFSMTEMLLKPVMTERILLQREIALAAHMDPMGALVGPEGARLGPSSAHLGPTSAQMDCAGASADCSALPTGPQQLRLAKQRQLLQAKLSRMSMLLKKEFTLKMILKAHQYSCLSWVQLAKIMVLVSPLPLMTHTLGKVVADLVEEGAAQNGRTQQG